MSPTRLLSSRAHRGGAVLALVAAALAILLVASPGWAMGGNAAMTTATTGATRASALRSAASTTSTRPGETSQAAPTRPTPTTDAGRSTGAATPRPTTDAGRSTGAATPTTPTTTYVPSEGTRAPNSSPGAVGGSAAPPAGSTGPTGGIGATGGLGTTAPGVKSAPGATSTLPSTRAIAARASHKRRLSTGWIIIAALGALLVLGCAAWGFARRRAYEPHWTLTFGHAMGEAGYRASATWAEFRDWARLGH